MVLRLNRPIYYTPSLWMEELLGRADQEVLSLRQDGQLRKRSRVKTILLRISMIDSCIFRDFTILESPFALH